MDWSLGTPVKLNQARLTNFSQDWALAVTQNRSASLESGIECGFLGSTNNSDVPKLSPDSRALSVGVQLGRCELLHNLRVVFNEINLIGNAEEIHHHGSFSDGSFPEWKIKYSTKVLLEL
jgi:hypothetical protein